MIYYAVIDTNVLVSSLLSKHEDASPVQIVGHLFSGCIVPIYNYEILSEYTEVLCRSKFDFSKNHIDTLIQAIRKFGVNAERLKTDTSLPDPKDIVFYEVAMAKRSNEAYLVTGNKKHFPKEPFVVTPNEMLEVMRQER